MAKKCDALPARRLFDATVRTLPADHVVQGAGPRIFVRDHGGAGAAVMLLPGGTRTLSDWDPVVPLLIEAGLRVVAMDLRGHGRSEFAPWSWSAVVNDVTSVVEHLGLRRPAVVGQSLGGMVAAVWAATHDQAECPLAVNINGHGNVKASQDYEGLDEARAVRSHQVVSEFMAELLGDPDRPHELILEIVKALDTFDPPKVYRAARCPVLIVSGERYMIEEKMPTYVRNMFAGYRRTVDSRLKAIAAQNELVELVTLPTTHGVHREAPDAVARLVIERLSREDPGPAGRRG